MDRRGEDPLITSYLQIRGVFENIVLSDQQEWVKRHFIIILH